MALRVPTEYCDVMPHLVALLQRAQATQAAQVTQNNQVVNEVEGKLGYFDSRGNFDSGVPLPTFNRLLKKMHSFAGWERVVDWTDTQDFYFDATLRGCKDTNGDAHFEHKTTVEHLNLRAPERQSALRISWKREEPAQPPTAYPLMVRIKKRKLFCRGKFEFAFTYVWQGKTLEEAQARQPTYEIEVECTSLDEPRGVDYLALSLLMKLGDLLHQPGQPLHLEVM
jgi:hypothetical protein